MTIEEVAAAVQAQVALASGLAGSQVIWENPNVPRPARPFISLSIMDDGAEQLLPEESIEDNPDPSPAVNSSFDLHSFSGGLFSPGAAVTAVLPNDVTYRFQLDTSLDTPVLTFEVRAGSPDLLIVHVGNAGAFTGTDVVNFINSDVTAQTYITAVGTGIIPIDGGIRNGTIEGGAPSQDPILLDTTDRPEITVRVTAFTAAPGSGAVSPAYTLLKHVRRRFGTQSVTDALDPLTVLDRGNVHNVTVMLETGYEGRAVLDLVFGSIETESDAANTIEEVQVEVTTSDAEGNVITDDTITLPNE